MLPFDKRAAVFHEVAKLLKSRLQQFIDWNVREYGSIIPKAQCELNATYEQLLMAAPLPMQANGLLFPSSMRGRTNTWRRRPMGIVSVIAQWNFPLLLAMRSVAPALALGNAVLLKPDLQSAITGGALIAELFADVGLPAGLLRMLPGGPAVGDAIVRHPLVGMISFTGSTAVGREIGEVCGRMLKKVELELGGNNPMLVLAAIQPQVCCVDGLNPHETSAALTALKTTPEHAWLNEVSSVPLQQALRHLQTAFANFFTKKAKYPNFRRKDGTQSAEYTASAFRWDGTSLKLAKMDAPLAIRWSRRIPSGAKVTTVTVSKDSAGRYDVSMLCDNVVSAKQESIGKVGIDFGLTDFVVISTAEKIAALNTFRKKRGQASQAAAATGKEANGFRQPPEGETQSRMHARIADSRRDFLHKPSTRLINENQVIAIESLAVRQMQKNRRLAKSISDAGWSEFVRQLTYKAEWYGSILIRIDRWYPSSKRCADCGHTVATLPLKVRSWHCPGCGATHDRDINAARNVLTAGLAVSAHGESASPMSL